MYLIEAEVPDISTFRKSVKSLAVRRILAFPIFLGGLSSADRDEDVKLGLWMEHIIAENTQDFTISPDSSALINSCILRL